ncbi:MAG: hypothetical protein K2Q22_00205 [Cytophagales bacterium]|nr:hypothetical protein [Cytophagales bacterium]
MLIEIDGTSNYEGGTILGINCYSFNKMEFQSVKNVLLKSEVKYDESKIKDKDGRFGVRYILFGLNIGKLERYLKIRFFDKEIEGNGDTAYRCERIEVLSLSSDCKTIYASDDDSANMICAIAAKKMNWFGGVAQRGICKKSIF